MKPKKVGLTYKGKFWPLWGGGQSQQIPSFFIRRD